MNKDASFLWVPDSLPIIVPPEVPFAYQVERFLCHEAHRIEHNVPIFRMDCELSPGLPAVMAAAGGDEADDGADEADFAFRQLFEREDFGSTLPALDAEGSSEPKAEEDEWVDDLPPNHFMTHLPKSKKCDTCLQAKLQVAPHRRRQNQRSSLQEARDVEEPNEHLERISVDHVFSNDRIGHKGESLALIITDRYSGLLGVFPDVDREAESVEDAIRFYCGRYAPKMVTSVASDRAPEIKKAVKDLGFVHEPSTPGDKIHNPYAESTIKIVRNAAASLLLHSGLALEYWPLAHNYFEFAYNVTASARVDPSITPFEAAMGYPYEGWMIPFGALVWYLPSEGSVSFAPRGAPALYLGGELIAGMKFKGHHKVWPLEWYREGVYREVVVRTLALPNGKWRFPVRDAQSAEPKMVPSIESYSPPKNAFKDLGEEAHRQQEESPAPAAGLDLPTEGLPKPDVAGSSEPREDADKRPRRRAITKLRIFAYGKTKKCEGCRTGVFSHTDECRERFNKLLDMHEPLKRAPDELTEEPKSSKPAGEKELTSDSEAESIDWDELLEYSPSADEGLERPIVATGKELKRADLERGYQAVAAILAEALDEGLCHETEEEEAMALSLHKLMSSSESARVQQEHGRTRNKQWFVEFCSSKRSACSVVAEEYDIPYLGLSLDFCNCAKQEEFEQVLYWASERAEAGETLHVWASVPWSTLRDSNLRRSGEEAEAMLANKSAESVVLVKNFVQLARTAVQTPGGTASFEWPRFSDGWANVEEVHEFISEFEAYSAYPTGCGYGLIVEGKCPLKPFRVATTSLRLAAELDRHRCAHPPDYVHDPIEGSKMEAMSNLYNRNMALSILCALFPRQFLEGIPSAPCIPDSSSKIHVDREGAGRVYAQLVLGLVHRALTRSEINGNPKAIASIEKEAQEVRKLGVWDDDAVQDVDTLKQWAKKTKTKIHLAEVMPISSVKNDELPPEQQSYKGRLVHRGRRR